MGKIYDDMSYKGESRKLKKKAKVIFLAVILTIVSAFLTIFLCGCGVSQKQEFVHTKPVVDKKNSVIFSMKDPISDDKGPGTYRYPTHPAFNSGSFDITKFEVLDMGDQYWFRIKFKGDLVKTYEGFDTGVNGWIHQLIDIYIDKDHRAGSGETKTLTGRDVNFSIESAWDKMILITPLDGDIVKEIIKHKEEDKNLMVLKKKIIIPRFIEARQDEIIAKVDKYLIGELNEKSGYQVLSMQFEENNALDKFLVKPIVSFGNDFTFTGGSNQYGDPNVIDILSRSVQGQYETLSKYSLNPMRKKSQFPTISCIYADEESYEQYVQKFKKTDDSQFSNLMEDLKAKKAKELKKDKEALNKKREELTKRIFERESRKKEIKKVATSKKIEVAKNIKRDEKKAVKEIKKKEVKLVEKPKKKKKKKKRRLTYAEERMAANAYKRKVEKREEDREKAYKNSKLKVEEVEKKEEKPKKRRSFFKPFSDMFKKTASIFSFSKKKKPKKESDKKSGNALKVDNVATLPKKSEKKEIHLNSEIEKLLKKSKSSRLEDSVKKYKKEEKKEPVSIEDFFNNVQKRKGEKIKVTKVEKKIDVKKENRNKESDVTIDDILMKQKMLLKKRRKKLNKKTVHKEEIIRKKDNENKKDDEIKSEEVGRIDKDNIKDMKNIITAMKSYLKKYPKIKKITIFDLILSDDLSYRPKCKNRGMYKIINKNGSFGVMYFRSGFKKEIYMN